MDLPTEDAFKAGEEGDEPASRFRYIHSTNSPDLLESLQVTLLVSTYQAGKLVAFRARDGRLSMLLRTFDRVMGLAADLRYPLSLLRSLATSR